MIEIYFWSTHFPRCDFEIKKFVASFSFKENVFLYVQFVKGCLWYFFHSMKAIFSVAVGARFEPSTFQSRRQTLSHYLHATLPIPQSFLPTFTKKWAVPSLFFLIFVFSTQLTITICLICLTGFESRISGVGGDRSTNWATTTTQDGYFYPLTNISAPIDCTFWLAWIAFQLNWMKCHRP